MLSTRKRLEQQLLADYADLQAAHSKIRELTLRLRTGANERLATAAADSSRQLLDTQATADAFLEASLAHARETLTQLAADDELGLAPWSARQWGLHELPADNYPPDFIRIGVLEQAGLSATLGAMPALLPLRNADNVFVLFSRSRASDGANLLLNISWRIAAFSSPDRYRLTLIDSQNLGRSLASLLNLPERIRSTKVYCQEREIQEVLQSVSSEVMDITQNRLRDGGSIEEYNARNPRLAVPYRFIVFTAFPDGFSSEAIDQLTKIAREGRRAGVYLVGGFLLPETANQHKALLEYGSCIRIRNDGLANWEDLIFSESPVRLDPPPSKTLIDYLTLLAQDSLTAPDDIIAFPELALDPDKWWTARSDTGLRIPLGLNKTGGLSFFQFGPATEAFNALVGGRPHSGKSNFLHLLILSLATQYSPDEVELYLIDFKEGVEFQDYADFALPHARAVVIEAEREFGLSVLQFLDDEMEHRAAAFKAHGVKTQKIEEYRTETGKPMRRIVALFDEFVHLFEYDDRLSDEAFQHMLRLVQRGRAFGIHLVLAAQRPATQSQNFVPIKSQVSLRLAFKCNDPDDSTLILGERNEQAAYLERTGFACMTYDPNLLNGTELVRVGLVTKEDRELYLHGIKMVAEQRPRTERPPTVVFGRKDPAWWDKQREVQALLARAAGSEHAGEPHIWLGQPVSLSADMKITLARQEGENLIIVGAQEQLADQVFASALLSLALDVDPDANELVFLQSPVSQEMRSFMSSLTSGIPHNLRISAGQETVDALDELCMRLSNREEDGSPPGSIVLFVPGLHRLKALRSAAEEGAGGAGENLARLLKEGPRAGIHTVIWVDRVDTLRDMTGNMEPLEDFAHLIALHMSLDESNALLDASDAARLGASSEVKRFLYRNRGWAGSKTEKVKPFEIPTPSEVNALCLQIRRRWKDQP